MSADGEKEDRLKGLALQMHERIKALKPDKGAGVVSLAVVASGRREPQLSDAELVAVRRMLAEFEKVATGCPVARSLLERE